MLDWNVDYNKLRMVALGEKPADLLLVNGKVISVFSGDIIDANVAVAGSYIAGVGNYKQGQTIVDLKGHYLIPGLIDSHIHIESSMLTPQAFAQAAVPHGTTAVLADPHEIVNVMGLEGWHYMVNASRHLPLDFFWQIPSCVPATHMETAGGAIGTQDMIEALELFPDCPALAEMMNYPGVVYGSAPVLELIRQANERGLIVEGHAPGLRGLQLNAYLASSCSSDHECTSAEEAQEKLQLGMRLLIRGGSAAKNLQALLPLVNEHNYHRCAFCCDDRHPADLLREGHLDHILRKAIVAGLPAVRAIQMATLNPAVHYRLIGRGAIAPGYLADMVLMDNLRDFNVEQVYKQGQLVAKQGQYLGETNAASDINTGSSIILPELGARLDMNPPPGASKVKVIEVIPDEILSHSLVMPAREALENPDINRMAVIERHGRNGNVGLGLVKGFHINKGALASSVSHDSHNLIVIGKDKESMEKAVLKIAEMGGGMAVVEGDQILAALALPVAGLMSPRAAAEVAANHEALEAAARSLGCNLPAPFMTLSFLALPVIPELRLTDMGLVDVNAFALVDLWD